MLINFFLRKILGSGLQDRRHSVTRDELQPADWSHYLLYAQDKGLVFSTEVSSRREEICVSSCLMFQAG